MFVLITACPPDGVFLRYHRPVSGAGGTLDIILMNRGYPPPQRQDRGTVRDRGYPSDRLRRGSYASYGHTGGPFCFSYKTNITCRILNLTWTNICVLTHYWSNSTLIGAKKIEKRTSSSFIISSMKSVELFLYAWAAFMASLKHYKRKFWKR